MIVRSIEVGIPWSVTTEIVSYSVQAMFIFRICVLYKPV